MIVYKLCGFTQHFVDVLACLSQPIGIPYSLDADSLNHLASSQSEFLEQHFSREEIKRAVRDCGGNRTPRLDGFTFNCISLEQSTFIKGRNILDGPLILNEVMAWYLKCKKKLMVFKFDFKKAFNSLRMDFLDLVMEKLRFGLKWHSSIYGCLSSARSSILVNGSPTTEFEIFSSLGQGDPLSPFLFILAMKCLHALMCKAEELGLYKWASFGCGNMSISHLIYADDVIFFGEWSWSNVLGVCVSDEEVSDMENIIGCGVTKFPLKYLGVPIGCSMVKCPNWNAIIPSSLLNFPYGKLIYYQLAAENVDNQSSGRLCNLRFLEYLKLYFFEYEHVAVNSTRHALDTATIRKPASLAALAVLVTGASQSRQHGKGESIWCIDQYGVLVLRIWSIDQYGVLVLRIWSIDQYGVLGLRIRIINQYGVLVLRIRSIDQYGVLGLRIRSIDQYKVLGLWIRSIGRKRAFLDS
ncbi:RNA-directed DNA polymerase, eukaryota, reverse transcriptase zinc-binding domain protein [Tanacetum coccineum]